MSTNVAWDFEDTKRQLELTLAKAYHLLIYYGTNRQVVSEIRSCVPTLKHIIQDIIFLYTQHYERIFQYQQSIDSLRYHLGLVTEVLTDREEDLRNNLYEQIGNIEESFDRLSIDLQFSSGFQRYQ